MMTPEEKLNKVTYLILEAIRYLQLVNQDDEARFTHEDLELYLENRVPLKLKIAILNTLTRLGALKESIVQFSVTVPEDDLVESYGYKINKKKFTGLHKKYKAIVSSYTFDEFTDKRKINFEENSGKIIFGSKGCQIPIKSIQYYVCKRIFSKSLGTRITETEIMDSLDREKSAKENRRTIYDAIRLINGRVKKTLGISKLINISNSTIWISEPQE